MISKPMGLWQKCMYRNLCTGVVNFPASIDLRSYHCFRIVIMNVVDLLQFMECINVNEYPGTITL